MLKEGDDVKIVYSARLMDMKLVQLVGQRGIVAKVVRRKKNSGAYIEIVRGKNAGEEWFIPMSSIQTQESLNRLRNLGLISSTKI